MRSYYDNVLGGGDCAQTERSRQPVCVSGVGQLLRPYGWRESKVWRPTVGEAQEPDGRHHEHFHHLWSDWQSCGLQGCHDDRISSAVSSERWGLGGMGLYTPRTWEQREGHAKYESRPVPPPRPPPSIPF